MCRQSTSPAKTNKRISFEKKTENQEEEEEEKKTQEFLWFYSSSWLKVYPCAIDEFLVGLKRDDATWNQLQLKHLWTVWLIHGVLFRSSLPVNVWNLKRFSIDLFIFRERFIRTFDLGLLIEWLIPNKMR